MCEIFPEIGYVLVGWVDQNEQDNVCVWRIIKTDRKEFDKRQRFELYKEGDIYFLKQGMLVIVEAEKEIFVSGEYVNGIKVRGNMYLIKKSDILATLEDWSEYEE